MFIVTTLLGCAAGRVRNADLFEVAGEAILCVPSMWRIMSPVCYVIREEMMTTLIFSSIVF